jgi:pyrrolidone-carboxylate peptidase
VLDTVGMTPGSLRRGAITAVCLALLVPLIPTLPALAGSSVDMPGCYDDTLPITVEEQRLDDRASPEEDPAAEQILSGTGFNPRVGRFIKGLCNHDVESARRFVGRRGLNLWAAATERAQTEPPSGQLPATDDRGLYWARITMAKHLHQWDPDGGVSDAERAKLIKRLEYTSRGITSSLFAEDGGVDKVLVTGFDPFTLDTDIRIGNPSGANALTLDGAQWTVGGRDVEIQTVVFPVRYADFDERMVEHALNQHYQAGPQRADMVTTASQGRVGFFDLEVYNGRRRSVSSIGDNNNVQGGGTYTDPVVPPTMPRGPEFLESSLPMEEMATASVPPFTTRINTRVVEIPAGEEDPVVQLDGPTEGSIAVEGSGGGYLSNEIAYRNTLRRQKLAPDMPAGHLHVPVLRFDSANPDEITDPTYEANREAIVEGAHRILRKGIAALA